MYKIIHYKNIHNLRNFYKALSLFLMFCFAFSFQVSAYTIKKSCEKVVTFKIGTIDKDFNLGREDVIKYSIEAADMWNNGMGAKLLEYKENGKVVINFKYDERQRKTVEKNILSEKKKEKAVILESRLKVLDAEKAKYEIIQSDFDKDWNVFKNKLESYNTDITKINNSGGANDYDYSKLNEDKNKLEIEKSELDTRSKSMTTFFETLNASVKSYNEIVSEANKLVSEINKNIGQKFEQGTYGNNKITIYEYENATVLKRLLAHELGHALKMGHTKNSDSIMHYLNSSEKFILTKEDIVEYYRVCGVK